MSTNEHEASGKQPDPKAVAPVKPDAGEPKPVPKQPEPSKPVRPARTFTEQPFNPSPPNPSLTERSPNDGPGTAHLATADSKPNA